jgi:3-mercaptopyruvate sulfurtransferase SseA
VALLLKRQGITRIRPLQGGLDAWRHLGYPVDNLAANASPSPVTTTGSDASR